MIRPLTSIGPRIVALLLAAALGSLSARAADQQAPPVLTSLFPAGGQVGRTVSVQTAGQNLAGLRADHAGIVFTPAPAPKATGSFTATIAADVPTGTYNVYAVSNAGISGPRAFVVGQKPEFVEQPASTPPAQPAAPQSVALDAVVNGCVAAKGDVDRFRFDARRGQRVIVQCRAESIDSRLRAVLEVSDLAGHRLAVNRGYAGIDPLIDFIVPEDGSYDVTIYDLTYTGSDQHVYRLALDTGPKIAFAVPAVVQAGTRTPVTLYGWNLSDASRAPAAVASATNADGSAATSNDKLSAQSARSEHSAFDAVRVEIEAPLLRDLSEPPLFLRSTQAAVDVFAYRYPGSDEPIGIGVTDVPVVTAAADHRTPQRAQQMAIGSEVSSQLTRPDERHWYAVDAKRGEVLWIEGLGARINSPVDLDVSIFKQDGTSELARFSDHFTELGGTRFPLQHLDPAGRWVAEADGRFLILVRNLIGGLDDDPRRVYCLCVRREEPDVHVVLLPGEGLGSLNVPRHGRASAEVLAFRSRGEAGSLCVRAVNLPEGFDCPDVWLGPGVERANLVVSAGKQAPQLLPRLQLAAVDARGNLHRVRTGVTQPTDAPAGAGRLVRQLPVAAGNEGPFRIIAGVERPTIPQGSILNITVDVEWNTSHPTADASTREVKLKGVALPPSLQNQRSVIAAGHTRGGISFALPAETTPGRYSLCVDAEAVRVSSAADASAGETLPHAVSNPVVFDVVVAPMFVTVDLDAPRTIKRGQYIQLNYVAKRANGFIGKTHTDLIAPGGMHGLRARGVTNTGQVEAGVLQIIAGDDSPLGRVPFLQLEAVGTVEDQPVYHAGCFVDLEIVE